VTAGRAVSAPRPLSGYTAREAAALLDVPPQRIHHFVRAGLLTPRRGRRGEYRLSFQDLVVLRAAKGLLDAGVSVRRVRRALAHLPSQLPRGRSLSAVRITAEGGEVVVRAGSRSWNPESGQALLDFEVAELAEAAAPLAPRLVRDATAPAGAAATDDWLGLACELEVTSPDEAMGVYRRVLALDPTHQDALLNLGRLLHEAGRLGEAEERYRAVLAHAPGEPVAAYNLGVALEDQGRLEEAAAAYREALAGDPGNADGAYNLAGVCERLGAGEDALRWLKEYRRLIGAGSRRH
jgi:tetratricopeptide (TPR) repeat protein